MNQSELSESKQYTTHQLVKLIGRSRQIIGGYLKSVGIRPVGRIGHQNAYDEDTYQKLKEHFSSTKRKSTKLSKPKSSVSKVNNKLGRGFKYGVPSTMMNVPVDIAPVLQTFLDEANPEQRQSFFETNVKNEIKRILLGKVDKL